MPQQQNGPIMFSANEKRQRDSKTLGRPKKAARTGRTPMSPLAAFCSRFEIHLPSVCQDPKGTKTVAEQY